MNRIISFFSLKPIRWFLGIVLMTTIFTMPSLTALFLSAAGLFMLPPITKWVSARNPSVTRNQKAGFTILLYIIGALFLRKENDMSNLQNNSEVRDSITIIYPAKIKIFNDVDNTLKALQSIGLGDMSPWKYIGDNDYLSISNYYSFGPTSSKNGMQDNFSFQAMSKFKDRIERIDFVLHINNLATTEDAMSLFETYTKKTFETLNIPVPKNLFMSYAKVKEFDYADENMDIKLEVDNDKIITVILRIQSK